VEKRFPALRFLQGGYAPDRHRYNVVDVHIRGLGRSWKTIREPSRADYDGAKLGYLFQRIIELGGEMLKMIKSMLMTVKKQRPGRPLWQLNADRLNTFN